jgi:hypothetical protein
MLEVQQPAQPLRLHELPFPCLQPSVGKLYHVPDSLMLPFGMVMRQALPDYMPAGVFAGQDELLRAFRLGGFRKSFREHIQIRGLWR